MSSCGGAAAGIDDGTLGPALLTLTLTLTLTLVLAPTLTPTLVLTLTRTRALEFGAALGG